MRIFDTKAMLTLVLMLLIGAIATGLTLAAGGTWPAALLAGGGGALTAAATFPPLMK